MHAWGVDRDEAARISDVPVAPSDDDAWRIAEALWDYDYFPCRSIPPERRGRLTRIVFEKWRSGDLSRRQALELLRAAPDESIEDLEGVVGTA